jgi:S1-C subfamily serine protease
VIFDYPNQILWLKPAKNYADGYAFDRSGMYLMSTGEPDGVLLVQYVVPGSPAQEAGIRRGDQLLKAGALPGKPENLAAINLKLQKKAGKKIRLRLLRDGQVMEQNIVLRNLL